MRRPNKTRIRIKKLTRHNKKYKKRTRHNKRYKSRSRKQNKLYKGGSNYAVLFTRTLNATVAVAGLLGLHSPAAPVIVGLVLVIYTIHKMRYNSKVLFELLPVASEIITNLYKLNELITKTENIMFLYLFNNGEFENIMKNVNNIDQASLSNSIKNSITSFKERVRTISNPTENTVYTNINPLIPKNVIDKNTPINIEKKEEYQKAHFELLGFISKDEKIYDEIKRLIIQLTIQLINLLTDQQVVELCKTTKNLSGNGLSELVKTEYEQRLLDGYTITLKDNRKMLAKDYLAQPTAQIKPVEQLGQEENGSKPEAQTLSSTNFLSKLNSFGTKVKDITSRSINRIARGAKRVINAHTYSEKILRDLTIINSYYTILKSQYDLTMDYYSTNLLKSEYDKIHLMITLQPEYRNLLMTNIEDFIKETATGSDKELIEGITNNEISEGQSNIQNEDDEEFNKGYTEYLKTHPNATIKEYEKDLYTVDD